MSRYICQNYSSKQKVGQPLANKNLAIVFDQFFIDDLSEDELNSIVDMYPWSGKLYISYNSVAQR